MTFFLPNTTVRLERGQDTDEFGDLRDTTTTWTEDLPAAITEVRQRSFQSSGQRGGQVEEFTIRLRPTTTVREGDRLVDERTGETYRVQDVHHAPTVVGVADVRVTATQVGAASVP